MKEFKIENHRIKTAEEWCLKHIGPRLYYLHNTYGGQGWRIKRNFGTLYLCIEDDKQALLAMLTLG